MSKTFDVKYAGENISFEKQLFGKVGFLGGSAILLSLGIIWFHNQTIYNERMFDVYSSLEVSAVTLMPYMISAAIAAITSLSIMNVIPLMKSKQRAQLLAERIRLLGEGDLVTVSRISNNGETLKDIAHELSYTVGQWNSTMSQLKIINRQQWDLLQEIKFYAAKDDGETVLRHLKKMEENWEKTAEIEDMIKT